MSQQYGLTFGLTKAELATVVANGVCSDDARVMAATNEATKVILDNLIPVNGMMIADVVADGTILLLPKEMENAIEVEVLGSATVNGDSDIKHGSYDIVSNFTYVDPSTAHDLPLDDLGLDRDPDDHSILRRKYDFPGLTAGATVRVTGAKRYLPITADGDSLIVQNVAALKLIIMSREYLYRGAGAINDSKMYLDMGLEQLRAEVKKHQMDPRRILRKKAAYQQDITTYAEGTLGRTRARLALELTGFLLRGKTELNYLVNRAVQMLVDNRNQLAITERISVHGGIDELTYSPAVNPITVLAWPDYNDIRLMVQSFVTESPDPNSVVVAQQFQKQAFDSQKAKLIEDTEKLRHTKYTGDLATYVQGTFGWMVARLALELPQGIAMTVAEIERLVSMSEMRLMEGGIWKGCLKTFSATIHGGDILFPRDVEAIYAASVEGHNVDIRSIFFELQKNGPGHFAHCSTRFIDKGEVFFSQSGATRRKYFYRGSTTCDVQSEFVAKVRWIQKTACDEMVIKNFEAIRMMAKAIKADDPNLEAGAFSVLEREMRQYLGGIQHVPMVDKAGFGFSGLGCPL